MGTRRRALLITYGSGALEEDPPRPFMIGALNEVLVKFRKGGKAISSPK